MFSFSGQIATLILRLDLHSTGKNSTRCPVSRWKWGQCLERSDCTLSLMMLVLRMMVVSSMTWPTPCTTNTMCVMSGRRSETAKGGLLDVGKSFGIFCEDKSSTELRERDPVPKIAAAVLSSSLHGYETVERTSHFGRYLSFYRLHSAASKHSVRVKRGSGSSPPLA